MTFHSNYHQTRAAALKAAAETSGWGRAKGIWGSTPKLRLVMVLPRTGIVVPNDLTLDAMAELKERRQNREKFEGRNV